MMRRFSVPSRLLAISLCSGALLLGGCADDPPCPDGQVLWHDGTCIERGPGCTNGTDFRNTGYCDREAADWSRGALLPLDGDRRDIYRLGPALPEVAARGVAHTVVWPVDVSGALLPWDPLYRLLEPGAEDGQIRSLQSAARGALGFGTLPEMYTWLGLARWDGVSEAIPGVPWPDYVEPGAPIGAGRVSTPWGDALTYSCATCHTADLFGTTVFGMTNRRARANEYFHTAARFYPQVPAQTFGRATDATEDELELFLRTQRNMRAIGSRMPLVRGLDTSLAQVALSLSRRAEDDYATLDRDVERSPRPNALEETPADSKPAVWWTLRYKTRWLSDGSIVSGNPIFTNFLWNEIGRGTDLRELERWLQDNREIVDELTVAAFAAEAPRFTDFFGADAIDIDAARRGHALFEATCAACHGSYEKAWDTPGFERMDRASQVATVRLRYHDETPVFDVGTSPLRAQGMAAFADRLNELAISQWMETVVEVQTGYVPPPLDGIWARFPYLHNQSVPTLCDMLRPAHLRPATFWMGPSDDPDTDFDADCIGFPTGSAVPESWTREEDAFVDTSLPGLSNQGHDEWLLLPDGSERYSEQERRDLIEFLKTL